MYGDTQCAYTIALHFDLLTKAQREVAMQRLVEKIQSNGWRLSTGFVGVGMLLPVLSDGGRDACEVVMNLGSGRYEFTSSLPPQKP